MAQHQCIVTKIEYENSKILTFLQVRKSNSRQTFCKILAQEVAPTVQLKLFKWSQIFFNKRSFENSFFDSFLWHNRSAWRLPICTGGRPNRPLHNHPGTAAKISAIVEKNTCKNSNSDSPKIENFFWLYLKIFNCNLKKFVDCIEPEIWSAW